MIMKITVNEVNCSYDENVKQCSRCGIVKPKGEFYKDKTAKDGLHSSCMVCSKKSTEKWRCEHRENIKKYNEVNKEQRDNYRKRYYAEHKAHYKEWRQAHKEEHKVQAEAWRVKNIEKRRESVNKYNKNRKRTERERLSDAMSSNINRSLKNGSKGGRHWENIVGYTMDQLKAHLEKQFETWMNWGNYGKEGWEIDHRIPITAFNFENTNDFDFKRCWSLENLRPLDARENMKKNNKLDNPFQPSLLI